MINDKELIEFRIVFMDTIFAALVTKNERHKQWFLEEMLKKISTDFFELNKDNWVEGIKPDNLDDFAALNLI